MNLSKESRSRVIKIKDSRFPSEVFAHHVRNYTAAERLEYNREMASEAGITQSEAGKDADQITFKGDPFGPAGRLYDKIVEKVEGYTADDENGNEVDVTTMVDWKGLIPIEHKNSVVMELIPRASVVKN